MDDLAAHVQSVNSMIGADADGGSDEDDVEEEWGGIEEQPAAVEVVNREDEYVDEDKYTTVTVEEVGITKDGFEELAEELSEEEEEGEGEEAGTTTAANGNGRAEEGTQDKKKRVWTKERPPRDGPKKRRKKFRYESKAERKVTKTKEKSRNKAQAKARRG